MYDNSSKQKMQAVSRSILHKLNFEYIIDDILA